MVIAPPCFPTPAPIDIFLAAIATTSTFRITGSTHYTSIVLKVQEDAIGPSPWLALSYDDRGHDFLPQFWLSLLDCGHDHVADTTSRESVQACTDTLDGDNVEITSARVVTAIHDRAAFGMLALVSQTSQSVEDMGVWKVRRRGRGVHWETERHLELVTGGRTSTVIEL
jgi:hypothetical protein